MSILPVVERELRVAARRPGTYRSRSLAALVVSAIAAGFILFPQFQSGPGTDGKALFLMLGTLASP